MTWELPKSGAATLQLQPLAQQELRNLSQRAKNQNQPSADHLSQTKFFFLYSHPESESVSGSQQAQHLTKNPFLAIIQTISEEKKRSLTDLLCCLVEHVCAESVFQNFELLVIVYGLVVIIIFFI